MPKFGIEHDYDLKANEEPSACGQTCAVCDASPIIYRWSDLYGEAMCACCGTPYQLKGGTPEQESEGAYPYLLVKADWLATCREYWQESHRFVHGGLTFGERPGVREFLEWAKARHPGLFDASVNNAKEG